MLNVNLSKAQLGKEAWHWQFGDSCAIDFSSGTPITGTCSIKTNEGCASISDPNTGQLLFYTDGTKVWDKNNNQMPNGFGMIGGQGTSTQAALIVPRPGSATIYYLISADQGGYFSPPNQGIHYSIVDMSLNGGLGDVTTKNTLLTPPPTTEKLTAVRHCNGIDYWIITHSFNSNAFNAYLLTSSGINLTPIVSNVGTAQINGGTNQETIGYLKASSNGKKLATAVYAYLDFVELFDFDNSTGIISHPIKITYNYYGVYGVAFSPDNSKLYTAIESTGIFQYDLTSNNPSSILSSITTIFSIPNNLISHWHIGAMQLATDSKIYVSFDDSLRLGVINNPNNLGLACNFSLSGPILPIGSLSKSGLPNFIEANNPIRYQSYNISLCSFPSYTISVNGSNNQWNTGDTTKNLSINLYGDYWVSYVSSQGCKEVDTFHIIKATPPIINLLKDTAQCANTISTLVINATDTGVVSYNWYDGTTNAIKTINNVGAYWIDYTFTNFCISRDSFTYKINPVPIINLGNDTTFCLGHLPLNAYNTSSTYLWNDGETVPNIIATKPSIYWVKVTNQYDCVNSDTLLVKPDTALLNFIMPNIVTPNNDGINDFIDFSKYQFLDLQLTIYNRWGGKVFESNDPLCIWQPIEDDGIYFYTMNYAINCSIENRIRSLEGFITLIK